MSYAMTSLNDFDALNEYLSSKATALLRPTDKIYCTSVTYPDMHAAYFGNVGPRDTSVACRTCQDFIRRYGHLAIIYDGRLLPLFWSNLPEAPHTMYETYHASMAALVKLFESAKISTVFVPENRTIGIRQSGGFNHFHFHVPAELLGHNVYSSSEGPILKEMLDRVLADNSLAVISKAHHLLISDHVGYAEHGKEVIRWLLALKHNLENLQQEKESKEKQDKETKGESKHNLAVQQAVHNSPNGFIRSCRSGLVSVLLESIAAGDSVETTKAKYEEKASPEVYLRPKAAPAAGAILQAERLFEEMGLTKSDLERRFAVHADMLPENYAWKSTWDKHLKILQEERKKHGVFSHLIPKDRPTLTPTSSKEMKITMAKFLRDIVPSAKRIEYQTTNKLNFYGFITGNKGTFPLMQWHHADNLMSWFTYAEPFSANRGNLQAYAWVPVTSIIPFPHKWKQPTIAPVKNVTDALPETSSEASTETKSETKTSRDSEKNQAIVASLMPERTSFTHMKDGYLFTLQDCRDTEHKLGASLFPSLMKSVFHDVRSVIEAYSESAAVADCDKAELCGFAVRPSRGDQLEGGVFHLRVTTEYGVALYVLDRFD